MEKRDGVLLGLGVGGTGGRLLLGDVQPDGSCDVSGEGRDLIPFGTPLPPARIGGRHAERDGERDNESER